MVHRPLARIRAHEWELVAACTTPVTALSPSPYSSTTRRELSMVARTPEYGVSTLTPRAVAVRRGDDDVDLVLVARLLRPEFLEHRLMHRDVVRCACSLGDSNRSSSSSSCSVGPWRQKKLVLQGTPGGIAVIQARRVLAQRAGLLCRPLKRRRALRHA